MDIIVDDEGRLDRVLRRMGLHFPQNLFEKWGRQKKIFVNGSAVKASFRVIRGDVITLPKDAVSMPAPQEVTPLSFTQEEATKKLQAMIIFEDNDILVLHKPEGIAVQGGTGQRTSIDDILRAFSPDVRFRLTHRIDKETSGLLLIAKTVSMATLLTNMFRDRVIEKTYVACCEGIIREDDGIIDQPIQKISKEIRSTLFGEKKSLECIVPMEDGKQAITSYKVLKRGESYTVVQLFPKTGRMHQLRVHMASLGHPIVGDKKYGSRRKEGDVSVSSRLMLHAWKISFQIQEKIYAFEAPIPHIFNTSFL